MTSVANKMKTCDVNSFITSNNKVIKELYYDARPNTSQDV